MRDEELRLLDFANEVADLIVAEQPSMAQVKRLGSRTGFLEIASEDVTDLLHEIVHKAFRDPQLRPRLLKEANQLFPNLAEKLQGLTNSYDNDRLSSLKEEIAARVHDTGLLRSKFREILISETHLDPQDINDIRGLLLASLNQISGSRDVLASGTRDIPPPIRRLNGMLTRIEGYIESCLSALIYFAQVNDFIEGFQRNSSRVGITEADRATAELIRLHELNHWREEIRDRLARLSEECDRIVTKELQ